MDQLRKERLIKKYSQSPHSNSRKATMNVTGRANRDAAMSAKGKPKNTKGTIIRLMSYLSQQKTLLIIAITCSIIFTLSSLIASYLLRPIMNHFIYFDASQNDFTSRIQGLAISLIFLAIIYAISVITQWLQQRLMLSVSQKTLGQMRKDLYHKLQKLPIEYFDNHPAGDIMSRFTNDIDTVGEMLNTTLIQMISGCITIFGTVILMLYTNIILGLITIVATPLLAYVSKTITKKGRKAYTLQQQNLGMLNGFAEEMITGQKVIKIFNHEDEAVDEFEFLNERLCESQIKAQFRAGIMGPGTHQLCNMIYAITACIGAIQVVLYGFDIGGLTVSLNFTRQFNRPINEISMQINTVFAALAGAERVFEVMDLDIEKQNEYVPIDSLKGHVVFDHVYFSHVEGVDILKDISLYAKPGQKIAFVGSTGAGKTTITNLLSRFYDINSGTITIDGIDIQKIDRAFLRKNIAMVLQDTHLFTGTVRENIRYGRLDASDDEVIEAAKIAYAHSFIMQLENGYDTMLENDGANLSQGQRQLLNIARAAISHAPILVLDEATSSVDTRTEKLIEKGMDALMENRTTFVIAHRLSTVRQSHAIMVLENGHIIERGTHDELLKLNGRYADLYNQIIELD